MPVGAAAAMTHTPRIAIMIAYLRLRRRSNSSSLLTGAVVISIG